MNVSYTGTIKGHRQVHLDAKRLMVVMMMGALKTTSIRNAPTIGTTRNAVRDGPNLLTVEPILAIAFGVAPNPWPRKPEIITAAS